MPVQHAFRITDPTAREVWDQAHAARDEWLTQVLAAAAAVHPDAKPYGPESRRSGVCRIDGLVGPDVPWDDRKVLDADGKWTLRVRENFLLDPVPVGWRWVTSRDCYRPTTKAAKEVLAAFPVSAPNARVALIRHTGMPAEVFGAGHVYWPGVFDLDGSLWLGYGCRLDAQDDGEGFGPGRGRTNMPDPMPAGVVEAKLSEFYAAQEAEQERRDAEKAEV